MVVGYPGTRTSSPILCFVMLYSCRHWTLGLRMYRHVAIDGIPADSILISTWLHHFTFQSPWEVVNRCTVCQNGWCCHSIRFQAGPPTYYTWMLETWKSKQWIRLWMFSTWCFNASSVGIRRWGRINLDMSSKIPRKWTWSWKLLDCLILENIS